MTTLRHALRRLGHAPGFTAIAVLTLALGIAINTSVFALVNALLLKSASAVRLDDVSRIYIGARHPQAGMSVPPPTTFTLAQARSVVTHPPAPIVAATHFARVEASVRIPGHAERGVGGAIDEGFAPVFGLRAEVGRFFERQDTERGAAPAVVLSDRLWREWFGGDRGAVGRATVIVDDHPTTLVGVAPRGFRGLDVLTPTEIWIPAPLLESWQVHPPLLADNVYGTLFVRTRPGTAADAIAAALISVVLDNPMSVDPDAIKIVAAPARAAMFSHVMERTAFEILILAGLVLVAACANVINMLYARHTTRQGEIAVRLALGSGPGRLFALFMAETTIITLLAGVIGVGLAELLPALTGISTASPSPDASFASRGSWLQSLDVSLGWRGIAYAAASALLVALVVGLPTAWRAARMPPAHAMASSGLAAGLTASRQRPRLVLVCVQITAAVLLLLGTALAIRQAASDLSTTVLFDTGHVTAARLDLALQGYNETRGRAFYARLTHDVQHMPGVESAAVADGLPGYQYISAPLLKLVPDRDDSGTWDPSHGIDGASAGISRDFFRVVGLPLTRGRLFNPADAYGAPAVAIVGESAAARLWPNRDPIGRRLMFGHDNEWRTVVGVVSDPIRSTEDTPWKCESCVAFVPSDQIYSPTMLVMLRSNAPRGQVDALKSVIRAIDPDMAIFEAAPLDDALLGWVGPARAAARLTAVVGLSSLAIAALGIYGVLSFIVSARTREFGIRLALGAQPRHLLKSVLDDAIHLILIGLLCGIFIAAVGGRLLEHQVMMLVPNDITSWCVVPVLVAIVGLIAGYIPARRASRVDPNVALKHG